MSSGARWRSPAAAAEASSNALAVEFQRTGSQEIFGLLVERHRDRVLRLVASLLGPGFAAEAEDVTQDVFVQVYSKLPRFRAESSFETWLYRIAYNRGVDRKRRARFRLPHLGEETLSLRPASSDPHAEAAGRESREAVLAAVEALGEPGRTMVHLYYWMEVSVKEIAEVMDMKPGTVKSHLYRARQRLVLRLDAQKPKEKGHG